MPTVYPSFMIPRVYQTRSLSCLAWVIVAWFGIMTAFSQSTVEDLYAVTTDKKLLRVDTSSGAGTLVTTLGVVGNPFGLCGRKGGHGEGQQMWLITTANLLYQLDPWTGK